MAPPPGTSTTRRDILSAYVASLTRIGVWVGLSAVVYRTMGPTEFALLALVRSTIGLLNYTALGIGPALVHRLARLGAARTADPAPAIPVPAPAAGTEAPPRSAGVLGYARGDDSTASPRDQTWPLQQTYSTAVVVTLFVFLIAGAILVCIPVHANRWLGVPRDYWQIVPDLLLTMGFGVLVRVLSEPAGAVLQTFGRITLDNLLLAITDLLWLGLFLVLALAGGTLSHAGTTFLYANLLLLILRYVLAHQRMPIISRVPVEMRAAGSLLAYGALFTVAQLADFLYAPTDYLLISHLLSTTDLAAYAPCVQIDGGLLLLVTGLATALFPKAALAHARHDAHALWRYYLRGTLLSTGLLVIASGTLWAVAPWLLRAWLGEVPPGTLAILPLVLLHTVIGGSSAVARSILLGAGRIRAFTLAVLLSGAVNVAASYLLVRHAGLGLTGIVIGTLMAVSLRCIIWMPWYTMRTIRRSATIRQMSQNVP